MVKWNKQPPKKCQMCLSKITLSFVDGKTVHDAWAIMCPACYKIYGVGLGTGKGQLYKRVEDKYLKVDG